MRQFCEVCGRNFRTLNLNHLRTHGIVSWEQYEEAVNQRRKPDQALVREVAHSVLHDGGLSDHHQRRLREIAAAQKNQMPGMLAASNLRRMLRVTELAKHLEKIDGLLFDEEKLANYSFQQLLDLAKFTSGDMDKMIESLADDLRGGKSFGEAVGTLVHNQYTLIQQNGVPTPFDEQVSRMDPRDQVSLLRRVEDMTARLRRGEHPTEEVKDVVNSATTDTDTAAAQ